MTTAESPRDADQALERPKSGRVRRTAERRPTLLARLPVYGSLGYVAVMAPTAEFVPRSPRPLLLALGAVIGLLASSCATDPGADCTPGEQGCACYQGAQCFDGLECVAGICGGGSGDDAGTGEQDTGETGDPEAELGICERFLECLGEVDPDAATANESHYGVGGSCWTSSSAEECRAECQAFFDVLAVSFPNIEVCQQCSEDADCPAEAPYCNEHLCKAELPILSCNYWGVWGSCRQFGEGFTESEKQEWCDHQDSVIGDGWMSASSMPCPMEGALGRCDTVYMEFDLPNGPFSIYYYEDNPDAMWTLADAETSCDLALGTWVPF